MRKKLKIFLITAFLFGWVAFGILKYFSAKEVDLNEEVAQETNGADGQLDNWFWQKGYPHPEDLTKKYQQAWSQFLDLQNNVPDQTANRSLNTANWVSVGPKVFGGRVLSLAINRLANAGGSRTIFAGSASGGIWKTYTGGIGATAWQPVITNTNVLGVSSIVYHPTDTSILLAGTGEVYRVETVTNGSNSTNQTGNNGRVVWKTRGTYGIGILRSTDAGATWTNSLSATMPDLFGIQKIKFDPTNASIVYACGTDGLYKSTNAGASFTKIFSLVYVNDIVINPANNQEILIANGNLNNTSKGLWRSTNGGTNFTQLTSGLPTASQYKGFISLTIAGTVAPYTVIAGVGKGDVVTPNSYNEKEVYRSTNFGTSWTLISNSNHSSYQAWFAHCITPFPVTGGTSTSKFFMAGVSRYVFTISGSTGTRTTIASGSATTNTYLSAGQQEGGTSYVHADVHDIAFVPGSTTQAYFATDGGVFRTTNANASPASSISFNSCNGGLQIQQFYPTAAQSRSNPTLFVGGLQDNNVVRSRGNTWARVIGGDGGPCLFKPDNEAILLGSTDTRGVSRSTDSGKTYGANVLTYLGSLSTPHDDRTSFMSPIAVGKANTNQWYAGSDNIHISTNAGSTFTNSGVPGTAYIEALHKPAVSIGVSDLNANKLYISVSPFSQNTSTYGLYYNPPANIRKSINGGTSFTTATGTLPDRIFTDIAISATNDDSVFVTLGGFGSTHIYVTGDGGSTWSPSGSGLPDVPFNCILIDSANANVLYAGCDLGVYVSPDRGVNWYDYNSGFWDATYVMDIVFVPGNKLRAVTHGKGIFETDRFDGNVVLAPVKVEFSGKTIRQTNVLNCTAFNETNISKYEIQRSADGFNFLKIGERAAQNNASRSNYDFEDRNLSPNQNIYYYRLKIFSSDGKYFYSKIVELKTTGTSQITILGNPFSQELNFSYSMPSVSSMRIQLINMQGHVLFAKVYEPKTEQGTYKIYNLQNLPHGYYILNIQSKNMNLSKQVLKE
ncbi:MAG: T9SS type A sorting domain-containing protein [Chitinophagaceae bacterium]